MTTFAPPVVAWRGQQDGECPLVVLLHGRGSDEADIGALAGHLPDDLDYAAVRAPIAEGGGTRGSPTAASAAPSPSPSPTPWPGSAAGSTASPPRDDRSCWSASAAAQPSPAASSSTTRPAMRVLTGQIVDIRRRVLRRMVQDAAKFLRLRESLKSGDLRVGGEERRVTEELARRLVTIADWQAPDAERRRTPRRARAAAAARLPAVVAAGS